MADWQQFFQSVILGVIFSFLLAKLFSIIFAFRDENLRIVRADPDREIESKPSEGELEILAEQSRVSEEKEPLIREKEEEENADSLKASSSLDARGTDSGSESESESDSDSDWEGVESTELDETFSAATAFVAATAADRSSLKVSNELQLQLYALYKIATEGPCSTPQPSAIKMTARAKW